MKITLDGANHNFDIPIGVDVTDDNEISEVKCFVNGNLIGTKTNQPYSWTWLANDVKTSIHFIKAQATDEFDNMSEECIMVIIQNTYFVWFWNYDPDYYAHIEFTNYSWNYESSKNLEIGCMPMNNAKVRSVYDGIHLFELYIDLEYVCTDFFDVKANTRFSLYRDHTSQSWWWEIEYEE
ncbi:MAG: hypothetical protein JW870_08755 [Candidatus Delongbacteria bacterium]|nr:hypothetical protein [Candidatus Delongbacteria bacterium]